VTLVPERRPLRFVALLSVAVRSPFAADIFFTASHLPWSENGLRSPRPPSCANFYYHQLHDLGNRCG